MPPRRKRLDKLIKETRWLVLQKARHHPALLPTKEETSYKKIHLSYNLSPIEKIFTGKRAGL